MSKKPFILIIGASSGIGYALADLLTPTYNVITAQREIGSEYPKGLYHQYQVDVRNDQSLLDMAHDLNSKGIKLKHIVYCAGIANDVMRESNKSLEDIINVVETNSLGLVRSIWHLERFLSIGSRFISVGSLSENKNYWGGAEYCASKAFNAIYMKSLRIEFMRQGVQFCTIAPGMTATDFHETRYGSTKKAQDANFDINQMPANQVAQAIQYMLELPESVCIPHLTITPHDQAEHGEDIRKYKYYR